MTNAVLMFAGVILISAVFVLWQVWLIRKDARRNTSEPDAFLPPDRPTNG